MKKWWWKILGVVIIAFTLVLGFIVPLKPGIVNVDNSELKAGETASILIQCYNSNFSEQLQTNSYLRIYDSLYLMANEVKSESYDRLSIEFTIPDFIPQEIEEDNTVIIDTINGISSTASLIISNEIDGAFVLPSSISIVNKATSGPLLSSILPNKPQGIMTNDHFRFPYRPIINETIRNTFFHITLWFAMLIMLIASVVQAIKYLRFRNPDHDFKSRSLTTVAIVYGMLGLITGSIWAKHSWGAWWIADVKLNMSAIAMLIYLAYFILRSSIKDQDLEARLASVFNIFAFVALIPLIFVVPRLTDSLHPGNGGNPALGGEDLDHTLRLIFYPAIIGFTLLGVWMATLYYRYLKLEERIISR